MIFASITGLQLFATLNPILSLLEQGRRISRIVLMPTSSTIDHAKRIRLTLAELGVFPLERITIQSVSSNLQPEGAIPTVLEVLAQLQAETENLLFNVAGGLNYLIASCTEVLDPARSTLLYPERGCIYEINLHDRRPLVTSIPTPLPLAIFDLFSCQGIVFTPAVDGIPEHLQELFNLCGLTLPKGTVSGTINGVRFDAIWNDGNTLRFLLQTPTYNKDDLRRLIAFSNERAALFDLQHRDIAVVTANSLVQERLNAETRNITLIRRTSMVDHELKKFVGFFVLNRDISTTLVSTGRPAGNDTLLLTSMGKDPSATFVALASHRPGRAILCYTPGDLDVERSMRGITAHAQMLPQEVAEIHFVPVSMAGNEILAINPLPEVNNLEINITPGPKSHGFFLALWGGWHGGRVYSLQNQKQNLARLNGPSDASLRTLTAPRPWDFLALRNERMREATYKGNIRTDRRLMLLQEIMQAHRPDPPDSRFPGQPVEIDGISCRYLKHGEREQLEIRKGKEVHLLPAKESIWFELLIGHVLSRSGATCVDIQLTARWGKEIEARLLKKQKLGEKEPHRTEIDVAAVFAGRYVIVSCKKWEPTEYNREMKSKGGLAGAVREVKSMAALFGRFALPLLAFYGHNDAPYQIDGVTLFGFPTYSDPKTLQSLIKGEFIRLGTTVRGE